MIEALNKNPVATISFVVVLLVAAVAYLLGDISFGEFAGFGVGANGLGSAAIGEARNRAGKGTGS